MLLPHDQRPKIELDDKLRLLESSLPEFHQILSLDPVLTFTIGYKALILCNLTT